METTRPGIGQTIFKIKLNEQWFNGNPLLDEEEVAVMEKVINSPAIIVYNDDFNTFEHVVECFMKYCGHGYEQALQCASIIDNNGKCDVKHGSYEELRPIYEALLDAKLSAKIEI